MLLYVDSLGFLWVMVAEGQCMIFNWFRELVSLRDMRIQMLVMSKVLRTGGTVRCGKVKPA